MNHRRLELVIIAIGCVVLSSRAARAQAVPTAARTLQLSAFAGASGIFTGLLDGRNLGITAGGDVAIRSFHGIRPALEIRGTYPVDSGNLLDEKEILGGIRLSKNFGRFMPYGDALFGRGEIRYINGFVDPTGTTEYLKNPTNVLSGGGGVDYELTDHFSLKADAQYQRMSSPVVTSGHIFPTVATVGVVYRLTFGHFPPSR